MTPELPEFLVEETGQVPRAAVVPDRAPPPGESGLWVFIFGDMTLFAAFFVVFLWEFRQDRSGFSASADQLLLPLGAVNTLVLLTSSLLVVLGVHRGRRGAFTGALLCGSLFVVLKVTEYVHEAGLGNTLATDSFFTFYYVFTGIHLLHVLVGGVLLVSARHGTSRRFIEGAGTYWHLVDLLWVVLFSLFYLAGAA
ncbi:cytochrome c oxidase subunit 3 family protein [Amycolatopsis acidicola]|uniref:Cytochrome aa3 subunit 3 n=1 Tax=Amycolatopsis acidicola TaxID=2596893 RepID=A0A5N0VJV9_9PSEU|nr:cytochrome c oxidase subunit 3 [Amycolatopsis acidicola]KAA9165968.1 cytochrome c oxidase subunit 3 family protein [Amycolatopsis acidicola]